MLNITRALPEKPIAIVKRSGCTFVKKVRNAEFAGARLVIIIDDIVETTDKITMADDGTGSSITVPSIFISEKDGEKLLSLMTFVENQPIVNSNVSNSNDS